MDELNYSTNCTLNEDCARNPTSIVLATIAFACLITTALFGNTSVIYVVYRKEELRENLSTIFVINLAITDLSSAAVVMTTSLVTLVTDVHELHPFWCNVTCAANYCLIIVSMITLAFIGVERYIAILHPFNYAQSVTRTRILISIVYAWLQGVAFALPPVVLDWNHYDYWEMVCAVDWRHQQSVYYVIFACICCFLTPAAILLYCYFRILSEIRSMSRVHCDHMTHEQIAERTKKNVAMTKTIVSLLIIVLCFFVCMTPFCVTKFLKVIGNSPIELVQPRANMAASLFGYMASMINPFVYAIFRPDFRQEYVKMFRRLFQTFITA